VTTHSDNVSKTAFVGEENMVNSLSDVNMNALSRMVDTVANNLLMRNNEI